MHAGWGPSDAQAQAPLGRRLAVGGAGAWSAPLGPAEEAEDALAEDVDLGGGELLAAEAGDGLGLAAEDAGVLGEDQAGQRGDERLDQGVGDLEGERHGR